VVIGQPLACSGPVEQMLGVVPPALKPVELAREQQGLVVAAPDVLDNPRLPGADDVGVALVDPGP